MVESMRQCTRLSREKCGRTGLGEGADGCHCRIPFPVGPHHCDLDGGRSTGDDRPRTPWGWNNVEGGRRRLFCFALQSRRRRKKAGDGRCGKTSEAKPVFGQTLPVEDADGASEQEIRWNTAVATLVCLAGIGDGAAWTAPVRSSLIRPAR